MVKINDINQITDQFEKSALDSIRQTYKDWIKDHYSKLWHLQSIFDELKVFLPTNGKGHNLPEELWDEIYKKFLQIISWVENVKYTSEDLSLKSLSHTWQKGFNEILYSLSDNIKLDSPDSLLHIDQEDKNGFRFRKRIYSFIQHLPLNIFGSNVKTRKIELHNFLIHYLEVPITNLIFELRQKFLDEISGQYNNIFNKISELKEKALFINELENIQDPFENYDYFEKIFLVAEVLNQADIILQSLHERENQFDQFIDDEWQKIEESILYHWQYAGTFILPNNKYRTEVLSYNKKTAEKNFQKYMKYWKELFFGVRAKWIRNVEIFILQLSVIQEFRKSSKEIITNNEVILNPAFEEILNMLDSESNIYKSGFTLKVFKQKIHSTKINFLEQLKNEKIPKLLDAISHTEMAEILDDYINHIDTNINKISNSHKIQKFYQNGRTPSKSKTFNIELQEILNNEIFQSLKNNYSAHRSEVKKRINGINRALNEINHLYDLNLESINTILKNNGSTVIDEPLSIVKTTFKRSKEIIEKLWQECKDSLVFSNELLVKTSKELYTEFQSLANEDLLLDFNSKLIREKSQIPLKNVFKKIYSILKIVIWDYSKFLINNIKHLILPEKQDMMGIEDTLIQYSKNSDLRLSSIPTVYQRLYMSSIENDNRFFLEREKVIDVVTKSFNKWKNGHKILTALVGENGSGKSNILNFIEKNGLNENGIKRINLESNIVNEKELLNALLSIFKYKNVKSLDELEKKLSSESNSQIVLLDNFHNLFLKVPGGFDILERFLLFLQNTQNDIFWIFAISINSWNFLDKILGIKQYINFSIYLDLFSKEQLKHIILKRHKLSGYKLVFAPNTREKWNSRLKNSRDDETTQELLENNFFDDLFTVSKGNINTAFKYWLTSIKEFKDENIYIDTINTVNSGLFEQLEIDDLLSLLPFIERKNYNIDDYNVVLRKLKHQNILSLNRLVTYGLIRVKDNIYSINMLYYPQISEILKVKKYLFEPENGDIKKKSDKSNNLIKINLYLPVKTDTLLTRKIAFQSTAVSNYVNLNKEIAINFFNKIYDGVSVLQLEIQATILNISFRNEFISEVTETILSNLFKLQLVSQEDFYNSALSKK